MLLAISLLSLILPANPPSQQHADTPFWQETVVRYAPEVKLDTFDLRSVRADRDGHVLVNTNTGSLKAVDGRLVPYDDYRGLQKLDHRDLEILRGKFVFLTDKFVLPLHGAGEDWIKNGDANYQRVGVLAEHHYVLLSPKSIVEWRAGKATEVANQGFTEIAANANNVAVVWSRSSLAHYESGGKITPWPVPEEAEITDVTLNGDRAAWVATNKGLFHVDAKGAKRNARPLPSDDLTAVAVDKRGWLWLGSTNGAFRIEPSGKLSYYAGPRWLAGNHVLDIVSDANDDIFVLSKTGLIKLDFERMTLEQKANIYLANLRRNHIRFGMVSDVVLPGNDYARVVMHDSDNDGLWSAMYLASEAFRYAVTDKEDARENLFDGLDALHRLVAISRIPGFEARSFELHGFHVSDPHAWRVRPEQDFEWKGTTSSDELTGTFFFYTTLYDTLCKKDPAVKERIAGIVSSICDHLIDHDLYYVDADGKPTRWGYWNPKNINTPTALHDRRLNSIEILGFLALAHELTGEERFIKSYNELVDKHGYAENTIHYLPDPLGPWNHSDDELYWLAYYTLLGYPGRQSLLPTYLQSAEEHFVANKRKRNPLWNTIYGARTGREIDLEGVVFWLQEFWLDSRTWPMKNSDRKDIKIVKRLFVPPEADPVLPPDERRVHKWNSNEMDLDGGGEGSAESGAEYLLPYWMARYHGYITEPKEK